MPPRPLLVRKGAGGMSAAEIEDRLRGLSRTEYELQRSDLRKECGVRAEGLDLIYRKVRPKREASPPAEDASTAWPDPVDGAGLLRGLLAALQRFVMAEEGALVAVALWVVHAHAHESFDTSPILLISSPVKGCGKSTLLDVIELLSPRALLSANTSSAALYRSTSTRPTILVDEADLYFSEDSAVVAFFNAGHRRGVPFRRCQGEDSHVVAFDSWCPKALAQIGMPRHPTIVDRSIVIRLRRKLRHEKVAKFRKSRCQPDLEDLRSMAARWAVDHGKAIHDARPPLPAALDNRLGDNWEPLFAIAQEAGGPWPRRCRKAVQSLWHDD